MYFKKDELVYVFKFTVGVFGVVMLFTFIFGIIIVQLLS